MQQPNRPIWPGIWLDSSFTTERAPDGPGMPGPIAGWAGTAVAGDYQIDLTGVLFCGGGAPTERASWGTIKAMYK